MISASLDPASEATPEEQVDEDLTKFDEWFRGLGNDPVHKSERAIIKTYLAWKLGLAKVG